MGENEAIGLATILKVIVGPLLLGVGLAYGIYRYRHGPVGTTSRRAPPAVVGTIAVVLILGVIAVIAGSVMVSRDIDRAASTTGSSTRPKEPGSGVDRAIPTMEGERAPIRNSNAPPAQAK
jgi:hypothetical protein